MAELVDSVARRYAVLRPHLNEFQRRLWLGAEAAELGPGGVQNLETTGTLTRDDFHGEWNYTLHPQPNDTPDLNHQVN